MKTRYVSANLSISKTFIFIAAFISASLPSKLATTVLCSACNSSYLINKKLFQKARRKKEDTLVLFQGAWHEPCQRPRLLCLLFLSLNVVLYLLVLLRLLCNSRKGGGGRERGEIKRREESRGKVLYCLQIFQCFLS